MHTLLCIYFAESKQNKGFQMEANVFILASFFVIFLPFYVVYIGYYSPWDDCNMILACWLCIICMFVYSLAICYHIEKVSRRERETARERASVLRLIVMCRQ